MRKVIALLLVFHADAQPARLRVAKVGAAAHLKVFLLPWRPRFHVNALYLEVCKIAGAALDRAHRNIQRAEKVHRIVPELIEPGRALLRLADDDHLLLFKLVDAINAPLLDAMRTNLLAEAGRIAGERLRQLILRQEGVDEFADHRMLARAD